MEKVNSQKERSCRNIHSKTYTRKIDRDGSILIGKTRFYSKDITEKDTQVTFKISLDNEITNAFIGKRKITIQTFEQFLRDPPKEFNPWLLGRLFNLNRGKPNKEHPFHLDGKAAHNARVIYDKFQKKLGNTKYQYH